MCTNRSVIWSLMILWLITAVPMAAVAQGPDSTKEKPSLWVEQSSLDLGEVTAGEHVLAVFVLHNDSDVPVKILKAKPS